MATFYDLVVTAWSARFRGVVYPCAIGRAGIAQKGGEGDNITPRGDFRINRVFFRSDRVHISGATPIGLSDIWSDDPNDPAYNSHLNAGAHAFSHERLRRADPMYDIIAALNYNQDPVVSGAGSAIFLHVWRKPRHPTAGCIAFKRNHLRHILESWTTNSRVIIR